MQIVTTQFLMQRLFTRFSLSPFPCRSLSSPSLSRCYRYYGRYQRTSSCLRSCERHLFEMKRKVKKEEVLYRPSTAQATTRTNSCSSTSSTSRGWIAHTSRSSVNCRWSVICVYCGYCICMSHFIDFTSSGS